MTTKEPGYVYILTNPSFREDWVKIGMSSRPVAQRVSELDNTSVPLPFDIYATMKTVKYTEAEKHIHRYIERFTNLRIRDNREFFNIKPLVSGYKKSVDYVRSSILDLALISEIAVSRKQSPDYLRQQLEKRYSGLMEELKMVIY